MKAIRHQIQNIIQNELKDCRPVQCSNLLTTLTSSALKPYNTLLMVKDVRNSKSNTNCLTLLYNDVNNNLLFILYYTYVIVVLIISWNCSLQYCTDAVSP